MTKEMILKSVFDGVMNQDEALKALDALEKLTVGKADKRTGEIYCKVSEKGGVSVYGLGRFPVTLYREQWDRLLAYGGDIREFILANVGGLATKEDSKDRKAAEKAAAADKARAEAAEFAAFKAAKAAKADGETDAEYAARKAAK